MGAGQAARARRRGGPCFRIRALAQGRGLGQWGLPDAHWCPGRKLEKLREKERKKEAKRKISSLSFTLEEEEEAGEEEEAVAVEEEELEREGDGRLGGGGGALPLGA